MMGIQLILTFLFGAALTRAESPPPVMWTLHFRSGSSLTVRVTSERPEVGHMMTAQHRLDLVCRDIIMNRIQEAIRQASEIKVAAPSRSVLVELPGTKLDTFLPDWVSEAIAAVIPRMAQESALHLHVTLLVSKDFSFNRLVGAIPGHSVTHFGLIKRNLIAGPQSLYRGWETFPKEGQIVGILPPGAAVDPAIPKAIDAEVRRLFQEAQVRAMALGEEQFPEEREQETFIDAVRHLQRGQKARLRQEVGRIRLEMANRISVDPVSELYAAFSRIRNCSATLES